MKSDVRRAHGRPSVEAPDTSALDVQYYLEQQPRQLPSRYLYDALGSALFEAICVLPWYTLTRAEARLLRAHASEILAASQPASILELGPGSGDKLAALIDGSDRRRPPLDLHLVDVSPSALAQANRTLARLDNVRIIAHQTTYEAGLLEVGTRRVHAGRSLVLLLGSNIGNFDPPGRDAFLRNVRAAVMPGDTLLLGADLVKSEHEMLLAYDDPLGVTAAFNRNVLVRINRELEGNFELDAFGHRAVWNDAHSRIEMHLVSQRPQQIVVRAASLEFWMADGESIWTESSYKYRPEEVAALVGQCGFRVEQQWIDLADRFALTLARAI